MGNYLNSLNTTENPVRVTAIVVGIITALVAALSVIAAGGTVLGAVIAGLGSLGATLGGGEAARSKVEPVRKAEARRARDRGDRIHTENGD